MKLSMLMRVCAVVLVALFCSRAEAGSYHMRELGLGGTPRGINNAGQVIINGPWGSSSFWSEATGVVSVPMMYASRMNNSGHVVGLTEDHRAVVWLQAGLVDIGSGWAHAINDSGDIGGTCEDPAHFKEGFVRTAADGNITYLGSGGVQDINNSGVILDTLQVMTPTGWLQLPGYANDLNDAGQVVGYLTVPVPGDYPYEEHAYLWTPGAGVTDLGLLPGDAYCKAVSVNQLCQIVGNSANHQTVSRPFLWSASSGMVDLSAVDSSFVGAHVYGINDLGQIVGVEANGNAALWTPVPEPCSLLALAGGVIGVGGLAFRRRAI